MAFYPETPLSPDNGRKLRVEIGSTYVSVAMTDENKPLAFEFFELNNEINDWSDIFFEVKNGSSLLNKHTGATDIIYNFKEALLVPLEKLSSAAAEDYLSLVYGESSRHDIKHDKLGNNSGMVNVYRVKKTILDQAVRHFHLFQAQHGYTEILNQLLSNTGTSGALLKVQVYPQCMIAVLMQQGQLQMIQHFSFETAEDVCYYLLSILKEHQLQPSDVTLEMSGLIEPHGELHRHIQQLFTNRSFHNIPDSFLLPGMMEAYHPHYFTPFFTSVP